MFVYALQGKSNTGKSLVLATLAVKILREYKDKINVLYSYDGYNVEKIESQIERKY